MVQQPFGGNNIQRRPSYFSFCYINSILCLSLAHAADIAQGQAWCGHASIATTRLYDRRQSRAEDSRTFKVAY